MTQATQRRTDEHNLRQAISEILEQTYALEYSMGLFYRKGNRRDLERASEEFEVMRTAVDRLGTILAGANQQDAENAKVVEAAE
jgi:hypothetical protein